MLAGDEFYDDDVTSGPVDPWLTDEEAEQLFDRWEEAR